MPEQSSLHGFTDFPHVENPDAVLEHAPEPIQSLARTLFRGFMDGLLDDGGPFVAEDALSFALAAALTLFREALLTGTYTVQEANTLGGAMLDALERQVTTLFRREPNENHPTTDDGPTPNDLNEHTP